MRNSPNNSMPRNTPAPRRQGRLTKVNSQEEPIHIQLGRISKHSAIFCARSLALISVVLIFIFGAAYLWISQNPVSLKFLVSPLQKAIASQMSNVIVKLDDAVVQKSENGYGIVFRLKNIRIYNRDGQGIAQAPSAAIGLSIWGMLSGRIAPSSVYFIGPKILLVHSKKNGLGLAFSDNFSSAGQISNQQTPQNNPDNSISNQIGATISAAKEQQVDLANSLRKFIQKLRSGQDSSSYLSRVGVRNAVVLLNSDNGQSQVNLPDIVVDLVHKDKTSIVSGQVRVSSTSGPWDFFFRSELSESLKQLTLWLQVDNLVPSTLADKFPGAEMLKAVDIPMTGLARVDLSSTGNLQNAEAKLTFGSGALNIFPTDGKVIPLEKGELKLRYSREKGLIEILPSPVAWQNSKATLSGGLKSGTDQNGVKFWQFVLQTNEAVLDGKEFSLPSQKIDKWFAKGFIIPEQKRVHLDQWQVETKNGSLKFTGDIIDAPGSPELYLTGSISPMPISLFKQIWPSFLAPGARSWIGERMPRGHITGGTVKVAIQGGLLDKVNKRTADLPDNSVLFQLGLKNIETHYVPGLPPMQASKGKMTIKGRKFLLEVPDAFIKLPTGKKIALTSGSLAMADLRQEVPVGIISMKTKSSATALLEFLDHKPLEYLKEANFKTDMISGEANGEVKITLPLIKDLKFSHMKLDGKIVLQKAGFPNLVKNMDVNNGTITFGITQEAVNARGRVYINAVPADIAWQMIFKGSADKQPGVRLTANLDRERLDKLGIPIGHMVRGEIPTAITMRTGPGGKKELKLQANLTNSELIFSNIGWRKNPGKRAALEMDIEKNEDQSTTLKNFKIVGDDIAVSGELTLGSEGKLKSFLFPDFSINVVTRLKLQGDRDEKGFWKIFVKGSAYDGRQFFQSMFSSGKVSKNQTKPKDRDNITVKAEIDTILGFSGSKINNVRLFMEKRDGRLSTIEAKGNYENGKILIARLRYNEKEARILRAETSNAGYTFRLIGFYPNMEGGQAALEVNLDAGKTKQTGTLWARDFSILGDGIVQEVVASGPDEADYGIVSSERRRFKKKQRERITFDKLKVPFLIGDGQFVLGSSYITGPSFGAHLNGQVNFETKKLDLGGTFIPLHAINKDLLSNFLGPVIGKGFLGITFTIRGSMDSPETNVNPISMVTPGIFRDIFSYQSSAAKNADILEQLN